jgi:hypothetical protein
LEAGKYKYVLAAVSSGIITLFGGAVVKKTGINYANYQIILVFPGVYCWLVFSSIKTNRPHFAGG